VAKQSPVRLHTHTHTHAPSTRRAQAVGFDAAEVHHLLGALFEDSQHLRAAVTRIRL